MSNGKNLTKNENLIYDIIQDYLKSYKTVEIDKLVDYIHVVLSKSKILLNRRGINKVLNSLIEKSIIIEGSRLTNDDILNNTKRKEIYDILKEKKGLFPYQIKKELKLPNHIIIWHLDVLVRFNFIKFSVIENHKVYYPVSISFHEVISSYFKKNEKCSLILDLLNKKNEELSQTTIANSLNMHPQTVKKYLKPLVKYNFLKKRNYSYFSLYSINKKN